MVKQGTKQFNITIELMFAGINMFLASIQTHFSPTIAKVKMSSEEGTKT
jgi:hypothetical protein